MNFLNRWPGENMLRKSLLIIAFFSVVPLAAEKQIPWNQFNETHLNGFSEGMLKLSAGTLTDYTDGHENWLMAGRFEYLFSDHFGMRGEAATTLSSELPDFTYNILSLGMNFHIFPRSAYDIYFGGAGGFSYISPLKQSGEWFSRTAVYLGAGYYFWGLFFLEAEGRYTIQHYAGDSARNLSGPGYSLQIGFYF